MAEGQTKKDILKKAKKKPSQAAEAMDAATNYFKSLSPTSSIPTIDKRNTKPLKSSSIETDSLGKVSVGIQGMDAGAAIDKARKDQESLSVKRGIASGLKDLSKRGALTPDLLKEARQRATDAGVTEEQFSSFMGEESIKPSNFATAAPTESKEEAAQNVMFQRQYGTGLGTLKAMQDPNYELGSGSALRQPARSIGPASGKLRRASRRLRRQGYGAAAQQMAMAGEMMRLGESSIDTPALRGQRMLQRIVAGREAQKQDKLATDSNNMFEAMGTEKPKSNKEIEQPKLASGTEFSESQRREQERLKRIADFDKPY